MKLLLLVDIQNDFLPCGALPVPDGDEIIPIINGIQKKFDSVVATQDWHPFNHKSFAPKNDDVGKMIMLDGFLNQRLWPPHAVQRTTGAMLSTNLDKGSISVIFRKGMDVNSDSYSGFFISRTKPTGLDSYAKAFKDIYIAGLATDYCVKATALDAVKFVPNSNIYLIKDACRGINSLTEVEAIKEMQDAGVGIVDSERIGND
jgi:nicotinamidase/pyrazinamidase